MWGIWSEAGARFWKLFFAFVVTSNSKDLGVTSPNINMAPTGFAFKF